MGILTSEQARKLKNRPVAHNRKKYSTPTPEARQAVKALLVEFPPEEFEYANLKGMASFLTRAGVTNVRFEHLPVGTVRPEMATYITSTLFSTRSMLIVGGPDANGDPVALCSFPEPHIEQLFSEVVIDKFNVKELTGPDSSFTVTVNDMTELNRNVNIVFGSMKAKTTGTVEFRYRTEGDECKLKVKPKGLKGAMATGHFSLEKTELGKALRSMHLALVNK